MQCVETLISNNQRAKKKKKKRRKKKKLRLRLGPNYKGRNTPENVKSLTLARLLRTVFAKVFDIWVSVLGNLESPAPLRYWTCRSSPFFFFYPVKVQHFSPALRQMQRPVAHKTIHTLSGSISISPTSYQKNNQGQVTTLPYQRHAGTKQKMLHDQPMCISRNLYLGLDSEGAE